MHNNRHWFLVCQHEGFPTRDAQLEGFGRAGGVPAASAPPGFVFVVGIPRLAELGLRGEDEIEERAEEEEKGKSVHFFLWRERWCSKEFSSLGELGEIACGIDLSFCRLLVEQRGYGGTVRRGCFIRPRMRDREAPGDRMYYVFTRGLVVESGSVVRRLRVFLTGPQCVFSTAYQGRLAYGQRKQKIENGKFTQNLHHDIYCGMIRDRGQKNQGGTRNQVVE